MTRAALPPALAGLLLLAACTEPPRPRLELDAAVRPGERAEGSLQTGGARPYAVLLDVEGGPNVVLGETLHLGLTPALTVLAMGTTPADGFVPLSFPLPDLPALAGRAYFTQAVVQEPLARNGLFRASNPQATAVHMARGVVVQRFEKAAERGYTGTFDHDATGVLAGAPVRVRTVRPQGRPRDTMPLQEPLTGHGVRAQALFRAEDLEATGEEEMVAALRFLPHGGLLPEGEFPAFTVLLGHSDRVPDYGSERRPVRAPRPHSGLGMSFADNFREHDEVGPLQVASGPWRLQAAPEGRDGFVPFPRFQRAYPYDGESSLLVEWQAEPAAANPHGLAMAASVMAAAAPAPHAVVMAAGSAGAPLTPGRAGEAHDGASLLPLLELELVRVESHALSPFLEAPVPQPDYGAPIVAATVPPGTSYELAFRGALSPDGTGATPFSPFVDGADGMPFLQVRVTFRANPFTGQVPALHLLAVPVD